MRLLLALAFFTFVLAGCEKQPKLPANYGIYVEENGGWQEAVASGAAFHKLSSRPSFLIFRREVGFTKNAEELAVIHPVHLIVRNVEEIRTEERKGVVGYTLEETNDPITATGVAFTLSIQPINGHSDMLIISPKEPLASGLYEFSALNQKYRFGVNVTDPKDLPAAQKIDKWFHTIAIKNQGSWDTWKVVSERGILDDARYKGRMLERSEFRPQKALDDTISNLRKGVLETRNYFEKMKIANLWRGLDAAAQTEIERLNNELIATLTKWMDAKDYYHVVPLEENVREVSPKEPRFENIFATAKREIEKREAQTRQNVRDALMRCRKASGSSVISSFSAIQGEMREKAEEGNIQEDGIYWHQKNLFSIEKGAISTSDIKNVSTKENKSVWDGKKYWSVTVSSYSEDGAGHWGHTFNFDSKQSVDTFVASVAKVKALWEQRYRAILTTKHEASPDVWGEKIWLNQVDFSVSWEDGDLRACKVRMAGGSIFDFKEFFDPNATFSRKDEWIQMISTNGKAILFTVTRLPYFGPLSTQSPSAISQNTPKTNDSPAQASKDDAEKIPPQSEPIGRADNGTQMAGERFPETRLRPLNDADLSKMDTETLRYAINEMYARHGADFKNDILKQQFAKHNWYRPIAGRSYDDAETTFSQIESENLKLLGKRRDELKNGHQAPLSTPPRAIGKKNSVGGSLQDKTRTFDKL